MIGNYLTTLLLQDVFLRKVDKVQKQNEKKNPYSLYISSLSACRSQGAYKSARDKV